MSARPINATSVLVEWFISRPNGFLTALSVNVTEHRPSNSQQIRLQPTIRGQRVVDGLSPYTDYEITVMAQTAVGWSPTGLVTVRTNESSASFKLNRRR